MVEVECLKVEREAEMAFTKCKEQIDKTVLHEIYPTIMAINKGNFDNMVLETN